jgi:putative tryptophan/tyrosine transport system substrate-binding protein
MRRREFITGLAGAAACPLAARAQQGARRVGALIPFGERDPLGQAIATAFAQGLARSGWVEGSNIRIDYRFAAGDPDRHKTYAAELLARSPDAVLAAGTAAVDALAQLTRTVPIVFVLVNDPVGLGLVQSLAHPGTNVTGLAAYDGRMNGKMVGAAQADGPAHDTGRHHLQPGHDAVGGLVQQRDRRCRAIFRGDGDTGADSR